MTQRLTAIAATMIACAFPLAAMSQTATTTTTSTSSTPTASTATTATTKKDYPIHVKIADVTVTAKVVELDKTNRLVTFFTDNKDFVTVRFPTKIHNFDQIRTGDYLVVHYTVAAAAKINPMTKDGIRETIESSSTSSAKKGAMPGAIARNNVQVLANIQSFDINARTVTIQGATRTITVAVPDSVDMSKLQVGDQVQAEFTDAVAIDFQRASAPGR